MSSRAGARRANRDALGWDRAAQTEAQEARLTPIHNPVMDATRRVLNPRYAASPDRAAPEKAGSHGKAGHFCYPREATGGLLPGVQFPPPRPDLPGASCFQRRRAAMRSDCEEPVTTRVEMAQCRSSKKPRAALDIRQPAACRRARGRNPFQYGKPRRSAIQVNYFTHQLELMLRQYHRRSQCFWHANPAVEVFRGNDKWAYSSARAAVRYRVRLGKPPPLS